MTSLLLLKSMIIANAIKKKEKSKMKKPKHKIMNMKKLSKATGVMCRICDQEKGEIPIFDNIVHPSLSEDIQFFSGVTMDKSDGFSKHLCQHCLDLLGGCVMFREICQITNKKLIEMDIKKESNVDFEPPKLLKVAYYKEYETEKHDSDGSFNVSSPSFTEDFSELSCSHCNESCYDLTTLNNHLKKCKSKKSLGRTTKPIATSKRKFLCDVCGKTAYSNANLLAHMSIHQPVFPFKCEICPYQGRTLDLLKVHKRSHMADKPYKCTHCPKATTTASNLAKHIRHVHSSARPHKCSYCEKAFSFQHDMKRHIKDIHLRQGTVDCDLCFKRFNTRKILRGHQWKVHKIKGERQGRLPAYLQTQMGVTNENHIEPSIEEREPVVMF